MRTSSEDLAALSLGSAAMMKADPHRVFDLCEDLADALALLERVRDNRPCSCFPGIAPCMTCAAREFLREPKGEPDAE